MPITDWPASERPREKLITRGAAALSDDFRQSAPGHTEHRQAGRLHFNRRAAKRFR